VTGSRDWTDRPLMDRSLRELGAVPPGRHVLLSGDCRGADRMAAEIVGELGWEVEHYPADWVGPCSPGCPPRHRRIKDDWRSGEHEYCPDAGKRRNQKMVDARPDVVIAFPTAFSIGTWDAVRRARKAGIDVEVVNAVRQSVGA